MPEVILLDVKQYKLSEVCAICSVDEGFVLAIIEQGLLEPQGDLPEEWLFSAKGLVRTQKAARLHRDLAINLEGISLVLELLDELSVLRQKMYLLEEIDDFNDSNEKN